MKVVAYPFHFLLLNVRFTIPAYSKAKLKSRNVSSIPKIVWQTHYFHRCTLPIFINYLFNRLMSLDYYYRYVSTDERDVCMKSDTSAEVYLSYSQLNNDAAQAALWRVVNLCINGGLYIDVDVT